MDQNLKTASEALARAAAASSSKDEPTKSYVAMERIDAGTRQYAIGDDIELTDQAAKQLLALGSVLPHGDKLAAKAATDHKDKDEQDAKDARAKLEAKAAGEEPNNLGYTLELKKVPASPELEYKIASVADDAGRSRNLQAPQGKNVTGFPATPGVRSGRAGVAQASRGAAHGSTAGKPPVGGKPKSGRK